MALLDRSEECRFYGTVGAGMVVLCQFLLGLRQSYDSIGYVTGRTGGVARDGPVLCLGADWDCPQAVSRIARALYYDSVVFYYFHVIFREDGDAIVVTELAN